MVALTNDVEEFNASLKLSHLIIKYQDVNNGKIVSCYFYAI